MFALITPLLFVVVLPQIPKPSPFASPSAPTKAAVVHKSNFDATPLKFSEFFEATPKELEPSAKLLRLNRKRVCLVGYMAQMEEAPKGAFYLCKHKTFCDEGGAGIGDIGPESVRVVVRSAKNRSLPFTPRLLKVTGILEVGTKTEENGQVSTIRLILDRPQDLPASSSKAPKHPSSPSSHRRRGKQ